MVLSSLVAVRIGAAGSVRDGCESGSAIGRGTKWSVAGEAVWQRGCGGLWSAAEGRPQAPWSSGRDRRCGRADGLTGLSRNGSPARSGYDVRGSVCCPALTSRRSLWRTCSDTVCACSRNGCFLDARNTSGGVHPGGGVEELRPGITTAKPYRGAGAEEVSWLACGTADFRRGSDPAAELRKAAGCPHTTDTEGE